MMRVSPVWALGAAALIAPLWVAGGAAALAYTLIYALAALPGLPLGFALFGRHHAAGWVGGALLGYGLTQLALWLVIVAGYSSAAFFIGAWLALMATTAVVARMMPSSPPVSLPRWETSDTRALLLVLLLVPLLMGPPYRNLGRADETGTRYYRAYFTADFLWHTALAYELGKFSLPPRNPYLAPRAMNYYWTYFLLPAAAGELSPAQSLQTQQSFLKANAILTGVLMMAALFLLVRTAVRRPWAAAAAVALATIAASAEGVYEIVALLREGRPLSTLLDTNIDAVTAWRFGGLRVDNIPRSLWYTPQHTMSIALSLVGLFVAAVSGVSANLRSIAGAGLALGLSTTINPLLGAVCSMIYGACIAADAAVERRWRRVPLHAIAAVPVMLAVAWGTMSRVMDGAGDALDIGFSGFSRHSPVVTLLLSLGPALLPAIPGLFGTDAETRRPVIIAGTGIAVGLFLLYFVRISEASWVGFRAGQILLVSTPLLLARTLERLGARSGAVLAMLILAAGLPTTLIDTFNAQDISNRRPGPSFRWTLGVTSAQQEAFQWLRANTPPDAIVQMEPMLRGREHWTLIPSFAGRRMAAGLPISLMPLAQYEERSSLVRTIFATENAEEGLSIAHRLRIDYLYVDRDDLAAYPSGVQKFEMNPKRFERVFANEEVRIYRVR